MEALMEEGKLAAAWELSSGADPLIVERLRTKLAALSEVESLLMSGSSWDTVSDRDGVRVQYCPSADSGTHNFKITARVRAPLFNLLAVVYEVDLYSEWMPRVKQARQLHAASRFEKTVHLELEAVWPVANRDCVVDGFGVDKLAEEGALLVVLVQAAGEALSPAEGVVRALVHVGGFRLTRVSPEETGVEMVLNVDPCLPVIPHWLLNWATGHVLHWLFLRMERAAAFEEDSEYGRRVAGNRGVYQHLRNILQ
jgi:hypothetical protein